MNAVTIAVHIYKDLERLEAEQAKRETDLQAILAQLTESQFSDYARATLDHDQALDEQASLAFAS